MNSQFKSLANIWANRRREDPDLGVVYVFTEKALQVYSEKIVKECAEIVLNTKVEYNEIDTMHRIRDNIKEHFGVKE